MAIRSLVLIVSIALAAAPVHACSIPVFRYALERWELSAYEILVFHDAPLTAEQKTLLKGIESGPPAANVRVEILDVSGPMSKTHKALFARHGKGQPLPWVAARVLDADPALRPAWSGPLQADPLKAVVESPLRHKIVDRLSRGETAAFVLLEGGEKDKDDAARAALTKELARLEKAIELPEQSDEGPQLRTGLPLKVSFAVFSLRRDDVAEQAFIKTMLATEEELDAVKGPIVFPIFGRGRLLCSMYDSDINPTQIANVARFLCGDCSCQVKELNPGVDLLIPANWPAILERAGPPANPRPDTPTKKKSQ